MGRPRGLAAAARQLRSLVVDVALRAPQAVRGRTVRTATERELQRRLERTPTGAPRAAWSRLLRSRNVEAVHVASSVAAQLSQPGPFVEELAARVAARPDDVTLRLDLCAALRRSGRTDRAVQVLSEVRSVVGDEVRLLVREALALGGREVVLRTLAGTVPRGSVAEAALRGARTLAERLASTSFVDLVESETDGAVLTAAVTWARHDGLESMQVLAAALQRGPGDATPAARADLADGLRDAGDLSISTSIAADVAQSTGDLAMRRLVSIGRSSLATSADGWTPPPAAPAPSEVVDGRVHYLLHSSLPYTSLGYAVRTQGLLAALGEMGWDARGITRPGFPEDRLPPPPLVTEVGGVAYRRLPEHGSMPHWPVETMVEAYLRRLEPIVREERPGIIHAASNYRNGLAAAAAARRAGLPSVYEVRGLWQYTRLVREPSFEDSEIFGLLERLEADAARAADRTIVITRALGEHLARLGVPEEKIVVVPNGVDTRRFVPRERDPELSRELGIGDRTVVGYVGGVVEYEGLGLLIDAAQRLATHRRDFVVLVVGDGRSLPKLQAQVRDHGIDDVVRFTGRVPHDQVERYYSLVDIAPFPRLPEKVCELVSPLKPFEAMAAGKAVVASDVAALAEIVENGATGLLFEKGSASALASALEQLLDGPELRGRVADGGLRWVRSERDWRRLATSVSEVWQELWSDHHGAVPRRVAARDGADGRIS